MARVALSELRHRIGEAIEQRRFEDAMAMARLILREFPKNVHARRLLAEALWEAGAPEEAREHFESILQLDPEDFVSYAGLGLIAEQAGQLDEALAYLHRASELAPASEEVRAELLRLHQRKGLGDSASLKITRAALARIYARSDSPARAIPELRAVLAEQPQRLDLRLTLAELLFRQGYLAEAQQEAEQVLRAAPDSIKAQLILAAVAKAEGRDQNAAELFERVRAMDPLCEYAERLLGPQCPLPPTDPLLDVPDYLLGRPSKEQELAELELELPDWLRSKNSPPGSSDTATTLAESEMPTPLPQAGEQGELGKAPGEAVPAPAGVRQPPAAAESPPLQVELPPATRPERQTEVSSLQEAWRSYLAGDLSSALATYRALLAAEAHLDEIVQALAVIVADSGDLDAIELLGDAYMRAGQYREAIEAYQMALTRLQQGPA